MSQKKHTEYCSNRKYRSFLTFKTRHTDDFLRLKRNSPNKPNIPTMSYIENQTYRTCLASFLFGLLDYGTANSYSLINSVKKLLTSLLFKFITIITLINPSIQLSDIPVPFHVLWNLNKNVLFFDYFKVSQMGLKKVQRTRRKQSILKFSRHLIPKKYIYVYFFYNFCIIDAL